MGKLKGAILVLSGPSGCGKSSMLKKLFDEFDNYYFSISTTTRDIREGEVEGRDYYFIDKEQFEKDIEEEMFLEWAVVHGNYYGTSIRPVLDALQEDKLVIFDIDVQGYKIIKEKLDNFTTSIFITTPSHNCLQVRLINRKTDSKEVIERRLDNAYEEMKHIKSYDYFIINDDLDKASDLLISIAKTSFASIKLYDDNKLLESWRGKGLSEDLFHQID
jgi:guanylate kinase